jgi:hypothetical protein
MPYSPRFSVLTYPLNTLQSILLCKAARCLCGCVNHLRQHTDVCVMIESIGNVRGRVVPRKIRQLKADLKIAGASLDRQRGTSHAIWVHPLLPGDTLNLSSHDDGEDAKPYQEKAVREFLAKIAARKGGSI